MLAYCKFNGIGVIPWAPLAAGVLARPLGIESTRSASVKGTAFERKESDADKAIISRVEELAKKHGWKMAQVALAWVNTKVTSHIVGFSSVERLQESLISGFELTPEEISYLEEPLVFLLVYAPGRRMLICPNLRYQPKVVRGHL